MSPPYASFESSDTSGASLLNTTTVLGSFTSIHERPIFWSLATNLGTTFKAPTNLGALALGLKLFLGKSMMQCHLKFLEASRALARVLLHFTMLTLYN